MDEARFTPEIVSSTSFPFPLSSSAAPSISSAAPSIIGGGLQGATDVGLLVPVCLPIVFLTAAALIAHARLFYTHVQILHPMYAVLMQECVALAIVAWLTVGSTVATFWAPEAGVKALTILTTVGSQLHQASWLVVTILR